METKEKKSCEINLRYDSCERATREQMEKEKMLSLVLIRFRYWTYCLKFVFHSRRASRNYHASEFISGWKKSMLSMVK